MAIGKIEGKDIIFALAASEPLQQEDGKWEITTTATLTDKGGMALPNPKTILFLARGHDVGAVETNENGVASITLSDIPTGKHDVIARVKDTRITEKNCDYRKSAGRTRPRQFRCANCRR